MLQVMLYAVGVALALSLMAYCEERLAVMRDKPRRWVWPATMVLSIGWAVGGILWVGPAAKAMPDLPVTAAQTLIDSAPEPTAVEAVTAPFIPVTSRAATQSRWSPPSDRTLLDVWAGASGVLLLHLIGTSALLQKRASRWQRAMVLGREVLVSEATGPALLGTWRPRIVVPQWFLDESPARQALILQHEEQHIAARDPLLLRAATLITLAVPWNLPLWWQLKRLRQAMEMDCDARVLRQGARPAEYGEVLLAVAQRASIVPAGLVAMGEPVSTLELRIRSLTPDPARYSVVRAVAAVLFGMVGIGAAAGLEAPPLPRRDVGTVPKPSPPPSPSIPAAVAPELPEISPPSQPNATALPRPLPPNRSLLAAAPGTSSPMLAAERTGDWRVEEWKNYVLTQDGVTTVDEVLITQGADTRITASHVSFTERPGGLSQIDLAGHVHIEIRGAVLDADNAVAQFNGENLVSIAVKGSQAQFSYRPEGDPQRVTGSADAIQFEAATSDVKFSGNASLMNDRGSLKSDAVVYNMTSGTVRDDGDPNARGQAIIRPGDDPERVPPPRQPDR